MRPIPDSPRGRLIGAGVILAVVIAVVVVIIVATGGSDDDSGQSGAYLQQSERVCIQQKQALAIVARKVEASEREPTTALALYAGAVADIARGWRARMEELDPPADSEQAAAELEKALNDVEATASRAADAVGVPTESERLGKQLIEAGARAEQAAAALGLVECTADGLGIGELKTG